MKILPKQAKVRCYQTYQRAKNMAAMPKKLSHIACKSKIMCNKLCRYLALSEPKVPTVLYFVL